MIGRSNAADQRFPIAGIAQTGNPTAADEVLRLTARRRIAAGKISLSFVSTGNVPMIVTVQTSPDNGTTWVASTSAANLTAITNETIAVLGERTYEFLVRADADTQARILVAGGNGYVQINGGESLLIVPTPGT